MSSPYTDEQLVASLQAKDDTALETVVRRYGGYVLTVIRKIGIPPLTDEDAEELSGDVFMTLWEKAHTIRDTSLLKAFLAQIARNAAVDRLRRHKELLPLSEDVLITEAHSPESIASLHEQTQIIVAALEAMDPTRRACMIYRYFYAEALTAIAKRLSLPLSTVKSHVYRGRRQLIDTLQDWGYSYEEDDTL